MANDTRPNVALHITVSGFAPHFIGNATLTFVSASDKTHTRSFHATDCTTRAMAVWSAIQMAIYNLTRCCLLDISVTLGATDYRNAIRLFVNPKLDSLAGDEGHMASVTYTDVAREVRVAA